MAITRDYKKTIIERMESDPDFVKALLKEDATLFFSLTSIKGDDLEGRVPDNLEADNNE